MQGIISNGFNNITLLHKDTCEQFTAKPREKVQLYWLDVHADDQPGH